MKITPPILLLLALMLSGCWVRIPGNSESPFSDYVNQTGTTKTNMIVVKYPDDSRYFAAPEGQFLRKEDKYYKTTIEKGTRIEVLDTASRLLPSGKHFYLECLCEIEKEEVIFDYLADGNWEPLSSKFVTWDKPIDSNKTAEEELLKLRFRNPSP